MSAPDAVIQADEPDLAALRGIWRLVGGPGTGITRTLTGLAVDRIQYGVDPESVLLLTGAGRPSLSTRSAMTAALLGAGAAAVVRAPLVRSLHSFAFGLLRQAAQRAGDPPPRLITSAEQDSVIRELLEGDLADGAAYWPPQLHAALSTAGFATELRDMLARCTERGVDPLALQRIGRKAGRPEWVAAGRFAQQYEQVMLLRSAVGAAAPQASVPALGAAELVGAALEALSADAELLATERARVKVLLIDDAQHLDPRAAQLVRVFAASAEVAVIAGDPNSAAFGFRGADPALLHTEHWPAIALDRSHRCAPEIVHAVNTLTQQLPGSASLRRIESTVTEPGSVTALLAGTESAEAALVADTLRRAHLVDGVPWAQMAVIVRSVPRTGALLTRALTAAGVPVAAPAARPPLAHEPVVRALLTVLTASIDGLTGPNAVDLLTGPIGRVDPVSLRQLRRALRRRAGQPDGDFGELLVSALQQPLSKDLAPNHIRVLTRLQRVLDAAATAAAADDDPRTVLWQAWSRTGLQRRLIALADRGGDAASRATTTLETVAALFDTADQFVSRTPAATLAALVDHVRSTQLPAAAAEPTTLPDAVSIMSPHQALGRDWHTVVIAGLQEGLWPNTIPRGGVLGTQRLLDALAGIDGAVSERAPLLVDERRLLLTAVGRARHHLVVTAVDGESSTDSDIQMPSPFFYEIARLSSDTPTEESPVSTVEPAGTSSPEAVIGRLRAVVCAAEGAVDEGQREYAAQQLARLAIAGVPGADPAGWHGRGVVSSTTALWESGEAEAHTVTLSPSVLQTLLDCPLRWMLTRHGGDKNRELSSALGTLVHALFAEPNLGEDALLARLDTLWSELPFDAQWFANNEAVRYRGMVESFLRWRAGSRAELTEVGTEVEIDGMLCAPSEDGPGVQVRGRVDRLERDAQGRLVIVDIKTGKNPVTKDDAQQHAQLAAYQLAVAQGVVADTDNEPGGGRLVYVGKPTAAGATERQQDPMSLETAQSWQAQVRQAAMDTAGPTFVARVNDSCAHCPVRSDCPAQRAQR